MMNSHESSCQSRYECLNMNSDWLWDMHITMKIIIGVSPLACLSAVHLKSPLLTTAAIADTSTHSRSCYQTLYHWNNPVLLQVIWATLVYRNNYTKVMHLFSMKALTWVCFSQKLFSHVSSASFFPPKHLFAIFTLKVFFCQMFFFYLYYCYCYYLFMVTPFKDHFSLLTSMHITSILAVYCTYTVNYCHLPAHITAILHDHMWPWTTKPVLSSTGIFVAIANNTLYG